MMAVSHAVVGLALWSGAVQVTNTEYSAFAALAVLAGSLAPDLDHPESWLGRRLPFIAIPLSAMVGHRGVTHSALALAAIWLALVFWRLPGYTHAQAFAIGYASHLAADFLTKSGIPILWPVKKRFKAPIINTGEAGETLCVIAVVAVSIFTQHEYWIDQAQNLLSGGL